MNSTFWTCVDRLVHSGQSILCKTVQPRGPHTVATGADLEITPKCKAVLQTINSSTVVKSHVAFSKSEIKI